MGLKYGTLGISTFGAPSGASPAGLSPSVVESLASGSHIKSARTLARPAPRWPPHHLPRVAALMPRARAFSHEVYSALDACEPMSFASKAVTLEVPSTTEAMAKEPPAALSASPPRMAARRISRMARISGENKQPTLPSAPAAQPAALSASPPRMAARVSRMARISGENKQPGPPSAPAAQPPAALSASPPWMAARASRMVRISGESKQPTLVKSLVELQRRMSEMHEFVRAQGLQGEFEAFTGAAMVATPSPPHDTQEASQGKINRVHFEIQVISNKMDKLLAANAKLSDQLTGDSSWHGAKVFASRFFAANLSEGTVQDTSFGTGDNVETEETLQEGLGSLGEALFPSGRLSLRHRRQGSDSPGRKSLSSPDRVAEEEEQSQPDLSTTTPASSSFKFRRSNSVPSAAPRCSHPDSTLSSCRQSPHCAHCRAASLNSRVGSVVGHGKHYLGESSCRRRCTCRRKPHGQHLEELALAKAKLGVAAFDVRNGAKPQCPNQPLWLSPRPHPPSHY